MLNRAILTSVICMAATPIYASESCTPAKNLVKVAQGFYGDNPELTNVISPKLSIGLKGINGHPNPSAMLYRFESIEHRLPLVDGKVEGLDAAVDWSKKGELCSEYADGPLPETEESTVNMSISFEFPFRQDQGSFSVRDIQEGAKDGSKVIKSMAPSGLGFAAPGLKTFAVTPSLESDELPRLTFMRDGKPVNVPMSKVHTTQYIRLKDIKTSKADTLDIEGEYSAFAFFKIEPDELAAAEAKRVAELNEVEN